MEMTEISVDAIDNPVNKKNMQKAYLGTAFVAVVVISYCLWRFDPLDRMTEIALAIIVAFSSSIPFFYGWSNEYWQRPYAVSIGEDGLTLYLRYRKTRIVHWDEIMSLKTPLDNSSMKGCDGTIFVINARKKDGDWFILYRPIAIAAREKYKEKVGYYPFQFPWEHPDYKGPRPKGW